MSPASWRSRTHRGSTSTSAMCCHGTRVPAWENWSRTQRCEPAAVERPGSREELAAVLGRAAGPVRVAGAGHSFTGGVVPAGALATGTHGTGARLPNLSAQVEAIELVLGDGSQRELTGGDLLRAARVGLGALGLVAAGTPRGVAALRPRGGGAP